MTAKTSIATIKHLNQAAGYCFFSTASMRFWGSRICSEAKTTNTGLYTLFVTSETAFPDKPNTARYTVQKFVHESCDVMAASDFQEYGTLQEATAAMTAMVKAL